MSHYFQTNKRGLATPAAGFSLTELLVTLSIVGILMTILVSSQSGYTDAAGVAAVADDISINVSQAQAYGIAVRDRVAGSSNFTGSYGLTLSILATGSNKAYLAFGDLDGDFLYDGDWTCAIGSGFECLGKTLIPQGHYIEALCVIPNSGADVCNTTGRIDISFLRPDTDAHLIFFNMAGSPFIPSGARGVRIMLKSPKGVSKSVAVYYNGQVSSQ